MKIHRIAQLEYLRSCPAMPPTEKQARILWMSLTALAIAMLVAILAAAVWGLGLVLRLLSPVLWPLAIAGVIAYLLDPIVDFLERRKIPRQRAIVMVFCSGVIIVGAFLGSIVPSIVGETSELVARAPAYTMQIRTNLINFTTKSPRWARFFPQPQSASVDTVDTNSPALEGHPLPGTASPAGANKPKEPGWEKKIVDSAIAWVTEMLPKLGYWVLEEIQHVASWAGFLIGFVMVPVFTFYFLQEKKGIREGWTHYLPVQESRFKEELVFVLSAINDYLIVFFRGQVVIALCDAVLLTIGFLSMGLNYAVLFGLAVGILGIVPYLGTIMTIVPAIAVAAVEFKDWVHPLLVIGIYAMVHLIEGFVVAPKIMGDRVGLHPLTIIVAVLVGTTLLGGILGGILAIPLTAALRVVMFRYVWKKKEA